MAKTKAAARKPVAKPASKRVGTKMPAKRASTPKPAAKRAVERAKPTTTRSAPTTPRRTTTSASAPAPEVTALLAEVLQHPDDDQARLVYADALEGRGDPRGTFISHHFQLAGMDPLDERYARLLASTLRLEAAHVDDWLDGYRARAKLGGFSKVEVDRTGNAVFARGFLHRIAMTPEMIAPCWSWLVEREPIAGIELLVGEHLPDPYRAMPCAERFRTLKVSPESWFTANSVGNVLAWGMPQLRDLDLSGCDLGVAGCQLLANLDTDLGQYFDGWKPPPPFAPGQLSRLILHACQISDQGARLLADAASIDGIVELDLGQCRLRERETLEALRASPRLHALTRLSLSGNRELAGQLDALAGWEVLARLAHLAVPASVSPEEVTALYPAPSPRLRELDLSAAKQALASPAAVLGCAEALTHLDIGTTSVGDVGWKQIIAASCVTRAIDLRANGCSLSDDAIRTLAASPMRSLVRLDLSSNKLTDAGLAALAAWPGLEHVAFLRIGNNRKLTATGYRALIGSSHFDPAVLDVGKLADRAVLGALEERFGKVVRT